MTFPWGDDTPAAFDRWLDSTTYEDNAAAWRKLVTERDALRAERDDFHMQYRMKCDEETKALRAANTKLVGAIDMIRETLNGGEVQDLHQIINAALAEYRVAQKPSDAQQFGGDLWSGIYGN